MQAARRCYLLPPRQAGSSGCRWAPRGSDERRRFQPTSATSAAAHASRCRMLRPRLLWRPHGPGGALDYYGVFMGPSLRGKRAAVAAGRPPAALTSGGGSSLLSATSAAATASR
eukprot:3968429-Heterocapsa_arctica.AAC.1